MSCLSSTISTVFANFQFRNSSWLRSSTLSTRIAYENFAADRTCWLTGLFLSGWTLSCLQTLVTLSRRDFETSVGIIILLSGGSALPWRGFPALLAIVNQNWEVAKSNRGSSSGNNLVFVLHNVHFLNIEVDPAPPGNNFTRPLLPLPIENSTERCHISTLLAVFSSSRSFVIITYFSPPPRSSREPRLSWTPKLTHDYMAMNTTDDL